MSIPFFLATPAGRARPRKVSVLLKSNRAAEILFTEPYFRCPPDDMIVPFLDARGLQLAPEMGLRVPAGDRDARVPS